MGELSELTQHCASAYFQRPRGRGRQQISVGASGSSSISSPCQHADTDIPWRHGRHGTNPKGRYEPANRHSPMPRAPSSTSAHGAARSTPAAEIRLFSIPTGPPAPRTPRFNSPPQSRQTRRAQATRYLPETSPGPRCGASSQGLDSRNSSRCQGVVMFSASSPTTPNTSMSPSGYPPDATSMFRAGSEPDPPCSGDLFYKDMGDISDATRCCQMLDSLIYFPCLTQPPIFSTVIYSLTKRRSLQHMSLYIIQRGFCGCPDLT
ncbi:hypothetical protein B0T18DRAFT_204797 [Schizothecium vesticola]|uniref:Uncharacterized protein n=1 Tax=Schizothecium vesticola TaxID=314040 RepID=A0AA40EJ13_9PEZI|nr:hypothetical protein B0T18DRAFT_204797 [Schizothecium vesticola]